MTPFEIKEKKEMISDEMRKASIEFFKEAMCVDGEVKLIQSGEFKIANPIIEFNDTKRGKFHMAVVIKKAK